MNVTDAVWMPLTNVRLSLSKSTELVECPTELVECMDALNKCQAELVEAIL